MCDYQLLNKHSKAVEIIQQLWPQSEFPKEFVLCYENQVPNVGVLLLSGELNVSSKKQIKVFKECGLFGLKGLLKSDVSKEKVTIKEGSVACVFDRLGLSKKIKEHPELEILIQGI